MSKTLEALSHPKRDPDKTREALLMAGFHEIHRHGFQAAGLDAILTAAGVTKGALYHHFENKAGLGYAIIDEIIAPQILGSWLNHLDPQADPIDQFQHVLRTHMESAECEDIELGCPLYNLIQEMSPIDEGFRLRLHRVVEQWRDGVARALRQGQEHGFVKPDIDPRKTATFFVAAVEGAIGLIKAAKDPSMAAESSESLIMYLDTLRPARVTVA
jgi:AcrR family transcriptional regulator